MFACSTLTIPIHKPSHISVLLKSSYFTDSPVHVSRGIRVWCELYQLDLKMQRVFKPAFENAFYSSLAAKIGHLRRKKILIAEVQSTCPKVADTRHILMFSSTIWLRQHRVRVKQLCEEKKAKMHAFQILVDFPCLLFIFIGGQSRVCLAARSHNSDLRTAFKAQ